MDSQALREKLLKERVRLEGQRAELVDQLNATMGAIQQLDWTLGLLPPEDPQSDARPSAEAPG